MKQFLNKYENAKVVTHIEGNTLTDQQFKSECDINIVLANFQKKGVLPSLNPEGVSGDFSEVGDFQACLDKVIRAENEFNALPAKIRERFGHNPKNYVDFVLNPANEKECIELGLRVAPIVEDTAVDVLKRIEKTVTPNGAKFASQD